MDCVDSPVLQPLAIGTQVLDQAREVAVEKVVCPICFEALSDLPNQVGALTFEGHRVETALYHSECVLNPCTSRLVFESTTGRAVSPLTRQQVDNFKLMPGLTESEHWVDFLDWNCSGHLDIQKVCFAVAALLPVDDTYAREFVLRVMNLPEESNINHELDKTEVIQQLLPQLRRQLRRLVQMPRPRPPMICRNSKQDELANWFRFWDSKKTGSLDVATLTLAVVTTFHTALARTADPATKDAVAHTFLTELGLRETDTVTESQFMEKMAPQLVANLPMAIERGSGSFDPKLPLTLILRDMKTATERPLHFEEAGKVTVGELRKATLRRFPVILCRRKVKLFVMGQLLDDDAQPLMHLRGIYAGATVNFMPGERIVDPVLVSTPKKKKLPNLHDLDDFDSSSSSEEELFPLPKSKSVPSTRSSQASTAAPSIRLSQGGCAGGCRCASHEASTAAPKSNPAKRAASQEKPRSRRASITGAPTIEAAVAEVSPSGSENSTPKSKVAKKAEPKKELKPRVSKTVSWDIPDQAPESDEAAEAALIPASKPCTLLDKARELKNLHFWLSI